MFERNQYIASKTPLDSLTEAALVGASRTALIILEIDKISDRYFSSDWDMRKDILLELNRFSNHTNFIVAEYSFQFWNRSLRRLDMA